MAWSSLRFLLDSLNKSPKDIIKKYPIFLLGVALLIISIPLSEYLNYDFRIGFAIAGVVIAYGLYYPKKDS